jgi:DNA-binding HxlR family transcriptional regulator
MLIPKTIKKRSAPPPPAVARMVEDIVGCKWSLGVLDLVNRGVRRPGAMQKRIRGISAKVLNERLKKLTRFGILTRHVYAEIPPRVEYSVTPFGKRFNNLLEQIEQLQSSLDAND